MKDQRAEAGDHLAEEASARRDFLKKSGRVAVAAPAVALLLAAGTKSALGQVPPPYTPGTAG